MEARVKVVRKWPSLELESLRIRQGNCILSNFLISCCKKWQIHLLKITIAIVVVTSY